LQRHPLSFDQPDGAIDIIGSRSMPESINLQIIRLILLAGADMVLSHTP
jgi:hypothetical protein